MLYLFVSLAIGLLISSVTKNQFVASMATLIITFLPAVFLSGFLFDIAQHAGGDPHHQLRPAGALLRHVAADDCSLPANIWGVVLPDAAILAGIAGVLLALTRRVAKKRLV